MSQLLVLQSQLGGCVYHSAHTLVEVSHSISAHLTPVLILTEVPPVILAVTTRKAGLCEGCIQFGKSTSVFPHCNIKKKPFDAKVADDDSGPFRRFSLSVFTLSLQWEAASQTRPEVTFVFPRWVCSCCSTNNAVEFLLFVWRLQLTGSAAFAFRWSWLNFAASPHPWLHFFPKDYDHIQVKQCFYCDLLLAD